jgi:hypothetical protein
MPAHYLVIAQLDINAHDHATGAFQTASMTKSNFIIKIFASLEENAFQTDI